MDVNNSKNKDEAIKGMPEAPSFLNPDSNGDMEYNSSKGEGSGLGMNISTNTNKPYNPGSLGWDPGTQSSGGDKAGPSDIRDAAFYMAPRVTLNTSVKSPRRQSGEDSSETSEASNVVNDNFTPENVAEKANDARKSYKRIGSLLKKAKNPSGPSIFGTPKKAKSAVDGLIGLKEVAGPIWGGLKIGLIIIIILVLIIPVVLLGAMMFLRPKDAINENRRIDTQGNAVSVYMTMGGEYKGALSDTDLNDMKDIQNKIENEMTAEEKQFMADEMVKLRASQDPTHAMVAQDEDLFLFLNIERFTYAFGGYLEWTPAYDLDGELLAEIEKLAARSEKSPNNGSLKAELEEKKRELERMKYDLNQYNRWMKKLDEYYLSIYPDKFFREGGELIPDLMARDIYGMETDEVIRHKNMIHKMVENVEEYTLVEMFDTLSDISNYLKDEKLEGSHNSEVRPGDALFDYEYPHAINKYEIHYEVSNDTNSQTVKFRDEVSTNAILKSLSYHIPIYEYVTADMNLARKVFFEGEIYDPECYDEKGIYQIDKEKFTSKLKQFTDINMNAKQLLDGLTNDLLGFENKVERAFELLYLNRDRIIDSKNHMIYDVENNKEAYYLKYADVWCDKYEEKVDTREIYQTSAASLDEDDDYYIAWQSCSEEEVMAQNPTRIGIEATVQKNLITFAIKPLRTTTLKNELNYTYNTTETGGDVTESQLLETICQMGEVYKITEEGSEKTGQIAYRKIIVRTNTYIKEKIRSTETEKRERD